MSKMFNLQRKLNALPIFHKTVHSPYLQFIYFCYLGGQSVSCKASLAALRLYGYFCDIVVLLSENKYDDDDEAQHSQMRL